MIKAIKPLMKEHGLAVIQSVDEGRDKAGLTCQTRIIHTTGEWIETTSFLQVDRLTPQGYGSAITYIRRYGLQAGLGLSADDDDGAKAEKETTAKPKTNITPVKKEATFKDGISAETKAEVIALGWNKAKCESVWDECGMDKDVFAQIVMDERAAGNLPY